MSNTTKTTLVKALAAVSLAVASSVLSTPTYAAGNSTQYISPGVGTLIIRWFSLLR